MVTRSGLSPVLGVIVAFLALPASVGEAETDVCGDVDDEASLGAAIGAFVSDSSCTVINITASFTVEADIPPVLIGDVDVFEVVEKHLSIHGNGYVISATPGVAGFIVRLGGADPTLSIDGLGMIGFSGSGALVLHSGNLVVERSMFSGNAHGGDEAGSAGATSAFGDVTIHDSQFIDNSGDLGGALHVMSTGTVRISNSTFANNDASNGGAVYVAAPELSAASLTSLEIMQSTFSGNTSRSFSAVSASGNALIDFSTIADNTSDTSAAVGVSGTAEISRSILYNNTSMSDSGTVPADITAGTSLILGDSLVTSSASVWVDSSHVDLDPSVMVDVDPLLGPLADNGGFSVPGNSPIRTRSLQPLSPARDRVSLLAAAADIPSTDQRGHGYTRVVGTAADLGAFEVQTITDPPTEDPPSDDAPPSSTPPSIDPPEDGWPITDDPVLDSPPELPVPHTPIHWTIDISWSSLPETR